MARSSKGVAIGIARSSPAVTVGLLFELATTIIPLAGLVTAMAFSLDHGYWITMLLGLPAGALLMRMFIIQHDCGHGSFLPSKRANDWLGRAISLITLTPYAYWRRAHALHAAVPRLVRQTMARFGAWLRPK